MENQERAGAERTGGERAGQALEFTGNWREYLPIAASNALLTIVTLGIYRFWAAARQRRYLWSRTNVIDDHLEWTGTGKEMFIGFLIVIAILAPFFLFIQFLFPALVARGKMGAASGILTLFYIAIIYLGGFARFRALRYRLSRSWWHGIRGGSDNPGWNYAGESLGRYALVGMTMFIMLPWSTTRLWNSRWNAMSFGPLEFKAGVTSKGLKWRWALVYIAPFAVLLAGLTVGVATKLGAGQVDVRPEERTAEDVVVADHVAALLGRNQIRHRRRRGEALRGRQGQGRQGGRSGDSRSGHGQRCARHGRGR